MSQLDPKDFIITRKRKKYKFALFHNSPLCMEFEEWNKTTPVSIIEVGAGTGLFGVELARSEPNKQVVAIDVKADRLQTGARNAEADGIKNVLFLRARIDQLNDILQPHSLEKIWITFPDPFPKDRSAKHRLTHQNFLKLYSMLLKKNGALYFKTDAPKLFLWSLEQLVGARWHIDELSFDLHDSSLPDSYKIMTTYETRYTNEGKPIHFVKATPPQS